MGHPTPEQIAELTKIHRKREKHLDKEFDAEGRCILDKEHHQSRWGDGKGNKGGDTK